MVGAGFAGLSAATALAERHVRVLVLEARPTLGGRASSFTDPATGERVDNGQHVLTGGYHETFRFLRRIGTAGRVHLQRALAVEIIDRLGRTSRLACPSIPAPLHLLAGALRWKAIDWNDRRALLRLSHAGRRRPDPDATVRQWLERHGQTPRLIELLWEPLALAALNQSVDRAAGAVFEVVFERMFRSGRRSSALALPLAPLEELYALPARAYLERQGSQVMTSSVARVRATSALLRVATRDAEYRPKAVICATAWYSLSSLFEDRAEALVPVLEAAESTAASPIVTVNLWLDRPVSPSPFVGLPGRSMQWVFDKGAIVGGTSSHLSLVSSGAESLVNRSNQDIVDIAVAELQAALPRARAAALTRAVVVREKHATFSVAPGQPPRPSTMTGVSGLFLAGDWIDTGLPATIEGAVASGHAAAAAALEWLGRSPLASRP